jgi:pimeloyl-ACP methyl ester carboxylesterase
MIRLLSTLLLTTLPLTTAAESPALAAQPAASAQTAPSAAFSSDRIGVTVRGQGPDVVLIPGLSSSPEVWDSTIAALPGYRYHLVHVAGFAGRPAGANSSAPVVVPVGEEIARYIREARLNRPAIVGHSMGGSFAMLVAGRHPELVSKVMVVDMLPFMGAMFGGPGATPDSVRPIAEQIRAGIAGGTGPAREASARQIIETMVKTESLRPMAVRHSLDSDLSVSAQAFYDLVTTDLTPELRNIRVPMTVLWVHPPGAPVTQEQMAGFYRMAYAPNAQARVVNVPDSRHFIMWDAPYFFQRELRAFLGGS